MVVMQGYHYTKGNPLGYHPPHGNYWIQDAAPKHGALHRQLHMPQDKPIPTHMLEAIEERHAGQHYRGIPVTPLLKHRVQFALNVRK